MRWRAATLGGLACCVALAGCALSPPPVAEIAPRVNCLAPDLPYFDSGSVDARLASGEAAPALGLLPTGFVPVRVVVCEPSADGAVVVRLYSGPAVKVAEAVSMRDIPRREGVFCPPVEAWTGELWLVAKEGAAVRARWPVDPCGGPQQGVRDALGEMALLDERTRALSATDE